MARPFGAGAGRTRRSRDQQRALYAYERVKQVSTAEMRRDYKTAVNDLGANVLRSGLCAALAALQRQKGSGAVVLEHVAGADLPGLPGLTGESLPGRVRQLDVRQYMLVTREVLRVAAWLKRAAQATFGEE